jgi:signal transduction histidine kinase
LNAIALHLEVLKDATLPEGRMDEDTQRSLGVIDQQFRAFLPAFQAFLRQGQPAPDVRSSFDSRELLDELVALLAPLAKEQRVELRATNPGAAVPLTALRSRVTLALLLVAINGMDAMPNGGELALRLDSAGEGTQVLISDTGSGIAAEHVDRIWDLHFTTKEGSSGIGLFVARSILREQGGSIGVDRTDAQGTTMKILLPAAPGTS